MIFLKGAYTLFQFELHLEVISWSQGYTSAFRSFRCFAYPLQLIRSFYDSDRRLT